MIGQQWPARCSVDVNNQKTMKLKILTQWAAPLIAALVAVSAQAADKKPNVVMLMQDDTGWNDFGCYSGGGAALGHPTPNVDRLAKEGAIFTC